MTIDLGFSSVGKVSVVTGGGSGIGAAIAAIYAAKGATVSILDLPSEAATARAALA
jgi:NAD(P)-dependent dehydrogenase (short-subunit alcohol dehydrogenase family)